MKHVSASRTRIIASLTVLATVVMPFVSSVQTVHASRQEYGSLAVKLNLPSGADSDQVFWYDIDGSTFGARGRLDQVDGATFGGVPTGTYWVGIQEVDGYSFTYGGDCDADGTIEVVVDTNVSCDVTGAVRKVVTKDADATLRIEKRLWNYGIGTAVFSDFSFTVNDELQQLEADGANEIPVDAKAEYTVSEIPAEGYAVNYSGDCDQNGSVTLKKGELGVCIITNWLAVGGYNPEDGIPLAVARAQAALVPVVTPAVSQTPKPVESISPSIEPSPAIVSDDTILGLDVCSETGHLLWWVTLLVLAVLLLWFGRRKGTYLWLIAIYALVWFLWAWKFCDFGYAWLPVLFAVIIWLLSVPRPGEPEYGAKQGSMGKTK